MGLLNKLFGKRKKQPAKEYQSNEEFFQAFQELIQRLKKKGGNRHAARELRDGLSGLNGLTDGSALLMESIERTLSKHRTDMPCAEVEELEGFLKVVRKAVYRK